MKRKDKYVGLEYILENQVVVRYLKIIGIGTGVVFGIYMLGHIFKISAHTINGFNQFKTAISNGN
jgi:hypothetical protein